MRVALLPLLLCATCALAAAAENETVTSPDIVLLEPASWDLGSIWGAVVPAMKDMHYVLWWRDDRFPDASPEYSVEKFRADVTLGYGWWLLVTHGDGDDLMMELFEYTPAGRDSQAARMAYYNAAYGSPKVQAGTQRDPYTDEPQFYYIAVTELFVSSIPFYDYRSVVHIGGCVADAFHDDFIPRPHTWMAYSTIVHTNTLLDETRILYNNLAYGGPQKRRWSCPASVDG